MWQSTLNTCLRGKQKSSNELLIRTLKILTIPSAENNKAKIRKVIMSSNTGKCGSFIFCFTQLPAFLPPVKKLSVGKEAWAQFSLSLQYLNNPKFSPEGMLWSVLLFRNYLNSLASRGTGLLSYMAIGLCHHWSNFHGWTLHPLYLFRVHLIEEPFPNSYSQI